MFDAIQKWLRPALSVDTIIRDFNKSIEELKYTEQHLAEKIKQKEAEKVRLAEEAVKHGVEQLRAINIRTKIEQLIA